MGTEQPHVRLLRDHDEIETLLEGLLRAFDSGDRSEATRAFQAFDRRLTAHLAFETDVLLPALAAVDRPAADEIAREHETLRARVDELAIEDNLHVSRASEIHRLVAMLRAHAEREEATLYELADRMADRPELGQRLDRLIQHQEARAARARA